MSLKNYSKLYPLVYTYLGYRNIEREECLDLKINQALKEIEEISSFRYIYQEFDEIPEFLRNDAYKDYLKNAKGFYFSAMTLGAMVDKRIHFYEKTDMLYGFIFDASASAYLEYMSDQYEANLGMDLGYRFCPGYQGTDVADIRPIYKLLKADKIGITLLDSNLMIPQKSMIGIVGIQNNVKKSCKDCGISDKCIYRKEGTTCYQEK